MKLFVVLSLASVAIGGMDYEMTQKWQKLKTMESCWGEENMKLHTLNMKKAVSKCLQVDAPETDLPPFRYLNRFTNNLVQMANNRHHQSGYEHGDDDMMKMMKMMIMAKMMESFGGHNEDHHSQRHGCNGFHDCDENNSESKMMKMMMRRMMDSEDSHDRMDTMDNMDDMDMFSKMFKSMKSNKYDSYKSNDYSPMMKRFMVGGRLSYFVQSYYFIIF